MRVSGNLISRVKTGIRASMLSLSMLPCAKSISAQDVVQFSHNTAVERVSAKLSNKAESLLKNVPILTNNKKPILSPMADNPIAGIDLEAKLKPLGMNGRAYIYEAVDKSVLNYFFNKEAASKSRLEKLSVAVIVKNIEKNGGKSYKTLQFRAQLNYPVVQDSAENGLLTTLRAYGFAGGPTMLHVHVWDKRLMSIPGQAINTSYFYEDSLGYERDLVFIFSKDGKKIIKGDEKFFKCVGDGDDKIEISSETFEKGVNAMYKHNGYDSFIDSTAFERPASILKDYFK